MKNKHRGKKSIKKFVKAKKGGKNITPYKKGKEKCEIIKLKYSSRRVINDE